MLGLKLNHVSKRGHWEQISVQFESDLSFSFKKMHLKLLSAKERDELRDVQLYHGW